jgi:iron complex outermembrane receptor protein
MDDFAANVNLSYIGEFEDFNETRTVDAQLLVDMSGSYRFNDTVKLSVGVNNVFDEEPSFAIGDGDADLYGYAMGVHNPLGRYIYTKVTMKF